MCNITMTSSEPFSRIYIVYCVLTFIAYVIAAGDGYSVDKLSANVTRTNRQYNKKCDPSDQFECKSGQCIPFKNKCNGFYDCDDNSDEIKETCVNIQCPGDFFKCDYGACVNGYERCNGEKDCVDNSDEENCETPKPKPTPKPTEPPTGGCLLPNHPNFGKWTFHGGASFKPGQRAPINSLIVYTCNKGYKLSRENKILACFDNGWTQSHPTCLKLCPALYTNDITSVRCFNQVSQEIKCTEASDGAYASFECAPYYEPLDGKKTRRYCYQGRWTLPPPKCIPVCGKKTVSTVSLIANGRNVKKINYPWVAAIYIRDGDEWVKSCGGTMITQKLILTAAHCVATEDGKPNDKSLYKVAVGKYYNQYMDERDSEAQYSDVDKFVVHEKYRGNSQRYSSDIAFIITVERLLFSRVVRPVCYSGLAQLPLTGGMRGVVTGWGFTSAGDNASDELKEITVPFKEEAECSKELPTEWYNRYAAVYDKFCAGYYNKSIASGVAVCKRYSGGGLVFENKYNNFQRYYVYGIVSLARKINNGDCDVELTSLYTNVSQHSDWLESVAAENT